MRNIRGSKYVRGKQGNLEPTKVSLAFDFHCHTPFLLLTFEVFDRHSAHTP